MFISWGPKNDRCIPSNIRQVGLYLSRGERASLRIPRVSIPPASEVPFRFDHRPLAIPIFAKKWPTKPNASRRNLRPSKVWRGLADSPRRFTTRDSTPPDFQFGGVGFDVPPGPRANVFDGAR